MLTVDVRAGFGGRDDRVYAPTVPRAGARAGLEGGGGGNLGCFRMLSRQPQAQMHASGPRPAEPRVLSHAGTAPSAAVYMVQACKRSLGCRLSMRLLPGFGPGGDAGMQTLLRLPS